MNQILVLQDLGISSLKLNDLLSTLITENQIINGFSDVNLIYESIQIIITIKEKVNETLLKQFPNTKLIAVAFSGFDVVDVDYCIEKLKNHFSVLYPIYQKMNLFYL
ncbi:MAG: hypothetical protein Q8J84_04715 [Flavobacteriaceae bacterium]|nr:hypothetical protein [Flavobacteriaceae bacterium]